MHPEQWTLSILKKQIVIIASNLISKVLPLNTSRIVSVCLAALFINTTSYLRLAECETGEMQATSVTLPKQKTSHLIHL